jgi:hypothetical protein
LDLILNLRANQAGTGPSGVRPEFSPAPPLFSRSQPHCPLTDRADIQGVPIVTYGPAADMSANSVLGQQETGPFGSSPSDGPEGFDAKAF